MKLPKRNTRQFRLDNGLVVALESRDSPSIYGNIAVNFGAYHEKPNERGLAHFLEHCLVMGGCSKYSLSHFKNLYSKFAESFNALTNIGRTSFYSEFLSEDLKDFLKFNSDMLFTPGFDNKRVEGERRGVLREIMDTKNAKKELIREFSNAFFRGHSVGLEVLGDLDTVQNANISDLQRIHQRGYGASNMILILAGGLPSNTEDLIRRYFEDKIKGQDLKVKFPEFKLLEKPIIYHSPAPGLLNESNPEESSAEIFLYSVAPPFSNRDSFAISYALRVLSNASNPRIFDSIRRKKGLVYAYSSDYHCDCNAGYLSFYLKVPVTRMGEALDALNEEFEKIKSKGITKQELETTRRNSKLNLSKTLDSNYGITSMILFNLDNKTSLDNAVEIHETLTQEDIRQAAIKYLPNIQTGNYALLMRDPLQKELEIRKGK